MLAAVAGDADGLDASSPAVRVTAESALGLAARAPVGAAADAAALCWVGTAGEDVVGAAPGAAGAPEVALGAAVAAGGIAHEGQFAAAGADDGAVAAAPGRESAAAGDGAVADVAACAPVVAAPVVGALAAGEAACRGPAGDAVAAGDAAAAGDAVAEVLRRTGSGDAAGAARPMTCIGRVAASVSLAAGRSGCAVPIIRRSGPGVACPDIDAVPASARVPTTEPVVVAVAAGSSARRSATGAPGRATASSALPPGCAAIDAAAVEAGTSTGASAAAESIVGAAPVTGAPSNAVTAATSELAAGATTAAGRLMAEPDGSADVRADRRAGCCAGPRTGLCPAIVPVLDPGVAVRAPLGRVARAGSGSTAATARRTAATNRDTAGAGRPGTGAEAPAAECATPGLDADEDVAGRAVAARAASPGTAGAVAPGPEPFPVEFPAGAPARLAGVRGEFSRARSWFISIGPAAVVASERRTLMTSACRPATMPPGV